MSRTDNNTFLSRVFGVHSSNQGSGSRPLFADDTEMSLYGNAGDVRHFEEDSDLDSSDSHQHSNMQSTASTHRAAPHLGITSENESSSSGNYSDDEGLLERGKPHHLSDDDNESIIPESLMLEGPSSRRPQLPNVFSRSAKQLADSIPKGITFQLPNRDSNAAMSHERVKSPPKDMRHEKLLRTRLGIISPMERSLWIWANVSNLDLFLTEVYDYYMGNGFYCICLKNMLDFLTLMFLISFSSFMGNCIDYEKLTQKEGSSLKDIRIPMCFSKISSGQKFCWFVLGAVSVLKCISFYQRMKVLRDVKDFYNQLLQVQDNELQTISWGAIVKRILILRDQNTNAIISKESRNAADVKSKNRLNAHEIANRIMRRENYMIALINKGILNPGLTLQFPFGVSTKFLSKTLEWNLNLCIFDYIFNSSGQIRVAALKETNRFSLSKELRKRLVIAGILNIFLAPFLVFYYLLYSFLNSFYDIKTNPNLITAREYSPLAKWKMREYNELHHIFTKRLHLSTESAMMYVNQFPSEYKTMVMKFFAFVSGSLLTVLIILTIWDADIFLNFEVVAGKSVLFYVSAIGAVYTVCKSAIPEENSVFDPERLLKEVSDYTHYLPKEWETRIHSEETKREFCHLYNMKMILMLKEILSLVMLPYLLMFRLPDCSERIVDFFREMSVHVDGLGYVCQYALFNVDNGERKHNIGEPEGDDKMMKSYMYFLQSYGNENLAKGYGEEHADDAKLVSSSMFPIRQDTTYDTNKNRVGVPFKKPRARNDYINTTIQQRKQPNISSKTKRHLASLNNSLILGESFDVGGDYKGDVGEYIEGLHEVDEEEERGNDGVLNLISEFYKKKQPV